MIGALAAPLPAFARDRDWHDWHRPPPVYVTPPYGAPAPVYPAPYAAPAYPAPAAYRSCNNALVGGLIGAAAGTLIGAGAGGHSRDGGAAAIIGLIGGAAVGTAVGAASCD
jgi:predicted lipid-binding transport protein (Tim44 family)